MNCRPEKKPENITIQKFTYISSKSSAFTKIDLSGLKKPSFSAKDAQNKILSRKKSICYLDRKFYQKRYLLGEGTYGKVYLFVSLLNPSDKIVVKEEKPFYKNQYIHTIKREAIFNQIAFGKKCGIAGDVKNPNKPIYIASPLINYPQLSSIHFQSAITLLEVALSIVKRLIYIHETKKYIHGDIKADNIFIKLSSKGNFIAIFNDHTFSSFPGETMGEIEASYIAPELKNSTSVHQNQDVYSLGKMLSALFSKHFKLISTEYKSLVKFCMAMSETNPDERIGLTDVRNYFITLINEIEKNHQLCLEKFSNVQTQLQSHFDEKNLLYWMELQDLNYRIKKSHLHLYYLVTFSKTLETLEQKQIPKNFENLNSTMYLDLISHWDKFFNIFKKLDIKNREIFLNHFGVYALSHSVNTAQQFATIYAMTPDTFKTTLLRSAAGTDCFNKAIKNFKGFQKITKFLDKDDFFYVWDNLVPESQTLIINHSPKKLLKLLKEIEPENFYQAINKLDINHLHSIFKAPMTLISLINSLENKGEIFLKQLIKISMIKKDLTYTMAIFDKYKTSERLYKKILIMANNYYYEFRSRKPTYLHCYGALFGYSKEDKLSASNALEQMMSGKLSENEIAQLKSKHLKLYQSGELMQIASRHFKC